MYHHLDGAAHLPPRHGRGRSVPTAMATTDARSQSPIFWKTGLLSYGLSRRHLFLLFSYFVGKRISYVNGAALSYIAEREIQKPPGQHIFAEVEHTVSNCASACELTLARRAFDCTPFTGSPFAATVFSAAIYGALILHFRTLEREALEPQIKEERECKSNKNSTTLQRG